MQRIAEERGSRESFPKLSIKACCHVYDSSTQNPDENPGSDERCLAEIKGKIANEFISGVIAGNWLEECKDDKKENHFPEESEPLLR